ncbi:hypothetical protein SKAU_G00169350 [Synaphobranchus kaupii]|uniref:Uncharacterized protein n=1 Tax=Synaphobranchus kaupii TaxID=118154 RepID=A0A9Q1FKP8_SYNKA|nr:hypothetical protein SKAU_G00169350 [Synaphobranchus kaupii]
MSAVVTLAGAIPVPRFAVLYTLSLGNAKMFDSCFTEMVTKVVLDRFRQLCSSAGPHVYFEPAIIISMTRAFTNSTVRVYSATCLAYISKIQAFTEPSPIPCVHRDLADADSHLKKQGRSPPVIVTEGKSFTIYGISGILLLISTGECLQGQSSTGTKLTRGFMEACFSRKRSA